jgi:putative peptidoglycan lipid II flippase
MTFLIMIPASVGLAVLGMPIIKMLFQRGEFTDYSAYITNSALFFYAFGLCAYGGIKLLVTCFYSMHDTKTPVKTALIAVALNLILSLILMWPLKIGGLALATSISASINFLMLYAILRKRIGRLGTKEIADSFVRVLSASIIMGIVLKFTSTNAAHVMGILLSMTAGAAAFIAAAYILRVKELKRVFAWASKRL